MDHKMSREELTKHPISISPSLQYQPLDLTMDTSINEHLAFLVEVRKEYRWTATEFAQFDSLTLYLEQQSLLQRPPNHNESLHRCLKKASREISTALALAEHATAAPGGPSDVHDVGDTANPGANGSGSHPFRTGNNKSPFRRDNLFGNKVSPTKKRKTYRVMENMGLEGAIPALAKYYEDKVMTSLHLAPSYNGFHTTYPTLPWTINVYSALIANPSTHGIISIPEVERSAEDAFEKYPRMTDTNHVIKVMQHLTKSLRLKVQRCEQPTTVATLNAVTNGPVLLAYRVESKCGNDPHIHFIIVCLRSGSIFPFVSYPVLIGISESVAATIPNGNNSRFEERMFDNLRAREWGHATFLGAWQKTP